MNNTTETPETEEARREHMKSLWECGPKLGVDLIPADFARKLELERDQAREQAKRWRDHWSAGDCMSMIATRQLPWETKNEL